MSDNAPVSPETVAEPSLAELFDPAALEARLAEARARRAEALARRATAGDEAPSPPRRPRIHTLDMAALGAPEGSRAAPPLAFAEASAAVPLTLVAAPARRPEPSRTAAAAPTLAPLPRLQGETRRGAATMPERLAVAVARPPAASPAALSVPAAAAGQRQPLAVLGLGLLVGAAVAVGGLVASRPPGLVAPGPVVSSPVASSPVASSPVPPRPAGPTAAVDRPELRFGTPSVGARVTAPIHDATAFGYGLPAAVPPLADQPPAAPDEVAPPGTTIAAVPPPSSPGAPFAAAEIPQDAGFAALAAVSALPPLALGPNAAPPPPAASDEAALPRATMAALPSPAFPDPPPTAPALPHDAGLAALSGVAALPPLALAPDAVPPLPVDAPPPATTMAGLPSPAFGGAPSAEPAVPRHAGTIALSAVAALPPLALGPDTAPLLPAEAAVRDARQPVLAPAGDVSAPAPVRPAPVLQAIGTPKAMPSIAAAEGPPALADDKGPADLRFAADLPDTRAGTAVTWPASLPADPSVAFALLTPAPDPTPPRSAERKAARPAAPAAKRAERQAVATAERPAPVRNAVVEAVNRARLERSVEDMLRTRLLED